MAGFPQIRILGGVGTIGGTIVSVEEGGYRVLFDFGTAYAPSGDFWGHGLHCRSGAAGLRDLIGLGYLPSLDGVYKTGEAETCGLRPGAGDRTQIFISHLHLDHMAAVDRVADEVPIWMHTDSLRLYRAVAETGERPSVPSGVRALTWERPVHVGPLRVTAFPVDHDIPGASALLIETSAGTVVYTGDFRLHGSNPDLVHRFAAAAAASDPRILLIEGTRLFPANPERSEGPPVLTEPEVASAVAQRAAASTGLALITMYPRNVDRIGAVARAAQALGRRLAVPAEVAYIYRAMCGDTTPISVYRRWRDQVALAGGTAPDWLQEVLTGKIPVVTAQDVKRSPQAFLLQLPFADLSELNDLTPPPGSLFIHSNGEPLGRFDPAYDLLLRWLDRFSIELVHLPSTGHADADALTEVVNRIRPSVLMPIHSLHPDLLSPAGVQRILPERGGCYDVATGDRISSAAD